MQIYSPILLTISHNIQEAWQSFEIIKKAKPLHLYIVVYSIDSIKEDFFTNEMSKMTNKIDWPCEVTKKILSNKKDSPIQWFFSTVDEGIIIQDKCIPDISFLYFAQAMLERYRAKKEIVTITGYNVAGNWKSKYSYFFSHIGVAGGWASWKRSWEAHGEKIQSLFEQGCKDWDDDKLMSVVPKYNLVNFLDTVPTISSLSIKFPLEHQIIFKIESKYDKLLRNKLKVIKE